MEDFVKQISSSTAVSEDQVRSFLGKMLDFIKANAPEDVADDISAKVPGADGLSREAIAVPPRDSDNGMLKPCMPVLDMLKKLIGQVLGGDAAKTEEITDIMARSGVAPDQGAEIIQKLLAFLKDKVGPDTVTKIVEQVPALQTIAA